MLTTLIYRSQLSLTCTSAALSSLVEKARIRNTEQGISGILLSRGRDVLQILEGTEQNVVALFNIIRADNRHTGVVELMRDYGPRRRFEDVGMLLFNMDVQTPKAVLASVLHYSKLESYLTSEDRVFKFIQTFIAGKTDSPASLRCNPLSSRPKAKSVLSKRLYAETTAAARSIFSVVSIVKRYTKSICIPKPGPLRWRKSWASAATNWR